MILRYTNLLFLIYIFLASCSKSNDLEEKAEAFLNELLFENGGCFTLLGNKPVTSLLVHGGKPEDSFLENLSDEALNTLAYVEISTSENFAAWKRLTNNREFENFFIVEIPLKNDPSSTMLFFANIEELRKILEENKEYVFQKTKISDLREVLYRLQEGQALIWHSLFDDHFLAGVLYGYGAENARIFGNNTEFSDTLVNKATVEKFPIPIFAVSSKDQTSHKYRAQKIIIQKFFKGRRLVDVTLSCLENKGSPK